MSEVVDLVECPRDAYQGLPRFIPTARKIAHLTMLAAAGFPRIDFGSFVSPKAVPQMADTAAVWEALPKGQGVEWIAIVANLRGAAEAATRGVPVAGFPLSINETFQVRNTGKDFQATWPMLTEIVRELQGTGTQLAVYLSMAFGNPYGEPHDPERVVTFARRLFDLGVRTFSLADTVGAAGPEDIRPVFTAVRTALPKSTIGLHLHHTPARRAEVIESALASGCRRFDSALGGIGGCPFAGDDLVGNLPTEGLVALFKRLGYEPRGIREEDLAPCVQSARELARLGGEEITRG